MTKWHSVSLGDAATAQVPLAAMREAFEQAFPPGRDIPDAAVFVRYEAEGRLHCEAVAFLTPSASGLAQRFEARPCARPSRDGLELVAGDERCWEAIFGAK